MNQIRLVGRIIFSCEIEAVTGLHIGGKGGNLEIGGVDNPVIRDVLTQIPYIPGSSLRGKMRSQLERKLGCDMNKSVGKAKIHVCQDLKNPCRVCRLFGMPASEDSGTPTRLIVRDVKMTEDSVAQLTKAYTDQPFTELKSEVAIDRVTAMASPRNIERVPAGAVFGPAEMVFSVFERDDLALLNDLRDGLQLIEDDYLGGGGSRGSGKIRFRNLKITLRTVADYSSAKAIGRDAYENLSEFEKGLDEIGQQLQSSLSF